MRRRFLQKILGMLAVSASAQSGSSKDMQAFEMDELLSKQQASGKPWLAFLKVPALYCGIYHLAKGAEDRQQPHDDDEVYYVESGRATIQVSGKERVVKQGSIIYVPAHADHRFVNIEEDLKMLVFFSTSRA